ncbi:MAG: NAD/NADP octopine/nopaline dehydrogenase family protein [Bacillota bacterium]|jgi:opine dehydrogenase
MAEELRIDTGLDKADFTIIGAGNGGTAMAGYLAMRGYVVNLWNRSAKPIHDIETCGGIFLEGEIRGAAIPNKVTTDIGDAVAGASVIMVTVPAFGHETVARLMAPHLSDGQIVVLNPGRTGGALAFRATLWREGCTSSVTVAEANTFVYASRTVGAARSHVFGIKKTVSVAALPATRTIDVVRALRPAFPQFVPVENVMVTSLDNMGAVFHPVPALLNAARIDASVPFEHYTDGITPRVASVLEALDAERVSIAGALDVPVRSALDWLRETYGIRADNLYDAIQANKAYHGISAPTSLNCRYITEDVPYSLVPMLSLAQVAGVKTPAIRAAVNLASALTGEDYIAEGRNAASMGITGMAGSELTEHVVQEVWQG